MAMRDVVYGSRRRRFRPGEEYGRPFQRATINFEDPEDSQSRGSSFQPDVPPREKVQMPGQGGVRAAVEERKNGGRYSILSREGRSKHPVASAVVAGAIYGSRAPEVLRRRDLEESEEERRQGEFEERRAERKRMSDALSQGTPAGYVRDPATMRLHPEKEPKKTPSEEEIAKMAKEGLIWSETEGKFMRGRSADREGPDLWQNEPPSGIKVPPGHQWIPGKGIQQTPKPENPERRTRHQIETSIRALEAQKRPLILAREKLKKRKDLLTQTLREMDPDSDEYRARSAESEDLDMSVAQMDSSLEEIEARSGGDYGELQDYLEAKEGMTWERYYALTPKQRRLFRESFKMPPGPDPGPPQPGAGPPAMANP